MKKLLLMLGFCCSVNLLTAQEITSGFQDSHHNLIGNIEGGILLDSHHNFLGQFKNDPQRWTILGAQHQILGFIVNGNELLDANNNTVGYLVGNADYSTTVQNAQHTTLGRIKTDGTVESVNKGIVGYAVRAEPMWAAAYFFMFKF